MKQPKKLTSKQKKLLSKKGLNANDYMLVSEDEYSIIIIHKGMKENDKDAIKAISK